MREPSRAPALAWLFPLVTFVVLMGATWGRHTDVGDAQVYSVVARHMVEDRAWTTLRYLPTVHPNFFEHLPFGLWPMVVAIRLFGERALVPLCALFAIATVWFSARSAARLSGAWAGVACLVVLATTERFFFQASYPTLDPLLILVATAAALPVLDSPLTPRHWLLAGAMAALGVAVKGPFGLVPFVGAVVGRALVERSWRTLAAGVAVGVAAALPVVLFVVLRADWLEGYGRHQLFDSFTGARHDSEHTGLYAVTVIAGRFWPWLPFLLPASVLATGRPAGIARWLAPTDPDRARHACQLLFIACVVVVVALSLPQRKAWHHTLVAYPLLAMLCGSAIGPRLQLIRRPAVAVAALGGLLLTAVIAVGAGLERFLMAAPCVLANEFAADVARLRPGQDVLVLSPNAEWDMLSALAFETAVVPRAVKALPIDGSARVAVVAEAGWVPVLGWQERARARGWMLVEYVAPRE